MRLLISAMLLFSAGYASAGDSICISVPRGSADPAVTACETSDSYDFTIVGTTYSYTKAAYQEAFVKLLNEWHELHGLTNLSTKVDFWLSVPEANPEATQARAVLRADGRSFVFFLSVHPQEWLPNTLKVSILGQNEIYPDYFGHSAGSLLVKRSATVQEADLHQYMENHQASGPQIFSPGWFAYELPVFREEPTKSSIESDPMAKAFVERVELNYIMEWISQRERVFAFSVNTP